MLVKTIPIPEGHVCCPSCCGVQTAPSWDTVDAIPVHCTDCTCSRWNAFFVFSVAALIVGVVKVFLF